MNNPPKVGEQRVINVFCGESCKSSCCNSDEINLSNFDTANILANITTRFDRFVDTPQDLPERIIDLLHIASYVFCADRCANRGARSSISNASWSRSWRFTIPVIDWNFWTTDEVHMALSKALAFMTGDRSYEFHFTKAEHRPLKDEQYQTSLFSGEEFRYQFGKDTDIMLFSGGLDSLAGAIERLEEYSNRQLCLINHMSNNRTIRTQRALARQLKERYPDRVYPYTFECRFKKLKSRDETQRTRMFLFSAIAFSICYLYSKDELYIYENGITSLNLSKQTDVINARASRTTHPKVIGLLQLFYKKLSPDFQIITPYYAKTKADIVNVFKLYHAENLIQSSVSCSTTRNEHEEFPHCGCCSQCIDRRFAVYAAGLQDLDFTYSLDILDDELNDETQQRVSSTIFFAENGIGDSKYDFLKKHPQELMDIIDYWPGSRENSLEEIYNLYCRYRQTIKKAEAEMLKQFKNRSFDKKTTFYGRVSQQVDYNRIKEREFEERVGNSVFVLDNKSELKQGSAFYLCDFGLLTAYHVTEDGLYYDVSRFKEYPQRFAVVGTEMNLICDNANRDYALYHMISSISSFFPIGNSDNLTLGDSVRLIGFSNYMEGDSYDIIPTSVRKKTNLFGYPLFAVNDNVYHGMSGGVVLDAEDRVVGLISSGIEASGDSVNKDKQGFIPINAILEDINHKGIPTR